MEVRERFQSKFDKSKGCWNWKAFRDQDGYGKIKVKVNGNFRSVGAHRISWELKNKKQIPKGMLVLHKCDNPSCVRPGHLFIGTYMDNNKDCQKKGRNARGDNHGSRLHPERRPRGEQHWKSKLTWLKVNRIRDLKGQVSSIVLGRKFDVTVQVIYRIWNNQAWRVAR